MCNHTGVFILFTNSTVMFPLPFLKDARYFQIIFQLIFLSYGIVALNWHGEYWLYTTYFITSLLTQLIAEYFLGKKHIAMHQRIRYGFPSVIISSLGLSLLLKTNLVWVAVLAAFISILSKYILRINGKHIFNPSALGIVVAVMITGKAWISPGQWGSGAVILFAVLCLGIVVTTKVQKLDVSIAFLGTFAGLLFIRQIIYLGWPVDHFIQAVSTGSLLLFSFFMITDPKTIPNHRLVRVVWCIAIAAASFYLSAFKFINGAPIFVLVLAQPLVPLLDRFFKARKFDWANPKALTADENHFLRVVYSRSFM